MRHALNTEASTITRPRDIIRKREPDTASKFKFLDSRPWRRFPTTDSDDKPTTVDDDEHRSASGKRPRSSFFFMAVKSDMSSPLSLYDPLEVIGNGSFGIIRKVRRKADGLVSSTIALFGMASP